MFTRTIVTGAALLSLVALPAFAATQPAAAPAKPTSVMAQVSTSPNQPAATVKKDAVKQITAPANQPIASAKSSSTKPAVKMAGNSHIKHKARHTTRHKAAGAKTSTKMNG